ERCLTRRRGSLAILEILVDAPDTPLTFKIAGLDAPYFPTILDENIVTKDQGEKTVFLDMISKDAENYRAIVGVEQSGANGTASQQNIFLDLFFSRPLIARQFLTEPGASCYNTKRYTCDPPKQRIWGDFRITSVPQPRQNLFQALNGSFSSG